MLLSKVIPTHRSLGGAGRHPSSPCYTKLPDASKPCIADFCDVASVCIPEQDRMRRAGLNCILLFDESRVHSPPIPCRNLGRLGGKLGDVYSASRLPMASGCTVRVVSTWRLVPKCVWPYLEHWSDYSAECVMQVRNLRA